MADPIPAHRAAATPRKGGSHTIEQTSKPPLRQAQDERAKDEAAPETTKPSTKAR